MACRGERLQFYQFGSHLQEAWLKILTELCDGDVMANLREKQAIAKQLAEIIDFTLSFDSLKMNNPGLQNDFRRAGVRARGGARVRVGP